MHTPSHEGDRPELINGGVADSQCELIIDVDGPLRTTVDTFSWYRIWEQASAIMYMCIADGKLGRSSDNGLLTFRRIDVNLCN